MKTIRKPLKNSILFHLISMLIPLSLMGIICILMHITPFGDHSFLIADMQKQYIDFFSYYKSLFRDGHGIFYTFSKCLGGDMYGFYTYYLTDPLYLLFLFIPDTALPTAVSFIILLHIGLCGLTMSIYLRSHFSPDESHLPCLWIFSTGYAMMGFLMANSFNVMWHGPIILFPLIILGLEKLVLESNAKLYLFALAASLFLNYYISYMLCIFSVLYFIGYNLLMWDRKKIIKRVGWFAGSSLLAGSLCAVFLLPTFFTIGGSLKDEKAVAIGITHVNVSPLHVLSKLFSFSFSSTELMNGMPNIFCGLMILVLATVYFFHSKICLREKLVYLGFLSILLISFCNAKLDYMWHAFMEPSGYPFRYAFIFSFLLLVIACKGLLTLLVHGVSIKTIIACISSFAILFAGVMIKKYNYINEKYELLDFAAFILIVLCLLLLSSRESFFSSLRVRQIAILVLIMIQLANCSLSSLMTYRELRNTSYSTVSKYQALYEPITPAVEQVKTYDSSFYRMENLNRSTVNNSMRYGYAGLSHYSSNEQFFVLHFLQELGLNYNRLYLEYGRGSTTSIDSLLGIKYLLANEDTIDKSYEKVLAPKEDNQLSVYQNPYALPLAFMASNRILSVEMDKDNPFTSQERIVHALPSYEAKDTNIFKNAIVSYENTEKGLVFHLKAESDGYIYFYANAEQILPGGALYLDGELIGDYFNLHSWHIVNLGYYQKGSECELQVLADEPSLIKDVYIVSEDLQCLNSLYQSIDQKSLSIQRLSDSHLRLDVKGDGSSLLFLSIPYESNWHITVDGKRTEATKVLDTLMALPISTGEHIVEMRYIPKCFYLGLIISLVSIIILICLAYRKRIDSQNG